MTSLATVDIPGVSYRQLDFWVRQGYVHPDNPAPGSGRSRILTDEEIRVVTLMARLVNGAGFQAMAAAEHARTLLRQSVYGSPMRLELAPGITLEVDQ